MLKPLCVVKANGDTVGNFQLPSESLVEDLREGIAKSGGPPALFQQLLCGDKELQDGQKLSEVCQTDVIHLLLTLPPAREDISVRWKEVEDTDQLLEELRISDAKRKRQWQQIMPSPRVAACAVEPVTGLVVLIGAKLEELEGQTRFRQGYGCYHPQDSNSEWIVEYGNFVEPEMVVVPMSAPPFDVPLVEGHPLRTTVELQVMESAQGYPMPSLGMGIALVREEPCDPSCRMFLVAFELMPKVLCETQIPGSGDVQAMCLDRSDRSSSDVFWVDRNVGGGLRCKSFQLRTGKAATCLFELAGEKRVTSIAKVKGKILLTRAGHHSIEIFDLKGVWIMRLGDPTTRGCQDGEADKVRFWFPVWPERLIAAAYGLVHKDSSPLITGAEGIFIYSGGVLMKLAEDFSVRKVMSVREELWMTDGDEGTPAFPEMCNVVGFHDNYLYRVLVRTDDREEVILRRLKCKDSLRQPRSVLRDSAVGIWPALTHERMSIEHAEQSNQVNVKPGYYDEKSRDTWDGNLRWLREPWLWDECGRPAEQLARGLRMHPSGILCLPPENDGTSFRGAREKRWEESTAIFID